MKEEMNLVTSRFNNTTLDENRSYKHKHKLNGCIYGSPLQLASSIDMKAVVYVIEMNNQTNQVEGIGVIRNYPSFHEPKIVYSNGNYNRYVYVGDYHLDREMLSRRDDSLIPILETLLFKGKSHMKRGAGLTVFPKRLLQDKRCPEDVDIKNKIREIFKTYFDK